MKKTTKKLVVVCTMATMMLSLTACGSKKEAADEAAGTVYTGVGAGNGGDITADVTVEDGKITKIEVTADSETPGIMEAPVEQIPAAIIETQSTEVDVVSGATITSNGIIEAVNAALAEAGLN